jgi:hypothetical protein
LSGDADAAPARARIGPWLMALLRLGAGALVAARLLRALLQVRAAAPLWVPLAVALGAGVLAFAWPRTCVRGALLLGAALVAGEALARHLGRPPAPAFATSLAIVGVLAAGEWLKQRLERPR